MLRFTILFMLALTNNNQEVTILNNIKFIDYLKDVQLYTHKQPYNKEWYKEI